MIRFEQGFITRLVVAHALLLALSAPALAAWENYQYEAFDSTETIFPTGPIGEATANVDSQGRYVVNGMNTGKDSLSAIRDNVSFYRVSTDCQILSSTAGELAFCGLLFHYGKRPGSDLPSYYVFYAYGDGFYGVKRIVDGGKSDIIIPLAATDLLTAGEPNTLAVEARGNRFELFINGEAVNDFTDMKLDGGGYGVYISKFSIAAFDNFEVQLEPAPVRTQAEAARNEPRRGIKPLDIPRNPERPLYPWEVGYDKNPKHKKKRIESERRGDPPARSTSSSKPPAKNTPRSSAAQPAKSDAALQRDTTSRRGDQGFIADEPEPKQPARTALKKAEPGTSIRNQYKQQAEPERTAAIEPEGPDLIVPDPEPEVIARAEPEAPPIVDEPDAASPPTAEPIELVDEPATDTGRALPDDEEEDLLYRRAPEFEEKPATRTTASAAPEEPRPEATAQTTENQQRKRGLKIGGDDWDSPRTAYVPKRRLPPSERENAEQQAATPADEKREPAIAIASDGNPVAVETVPLDGAPMRDPELEAGSAEPESEPEQAHRESGRAEVRLPESAAEPKPDAEAALDLELPEVPTVAEEEFELPEPEESLPEAPAVPGLETVSITDDFTSQQVWQTQDLPTSSYKYAEGGYAIDNRNAQTMAISYQQDVLRDLNLAVDALHSGGADYVGYGVAGRFLLEYDAAGRPQISYYGLFISRSGEFMLLKVVRGAETVLRDWTTTPLINLGGSNTIELRIEGATLTALINGREAATLTDRDIASGGYALLAGPGIAAQFDNLSLTGVRE